MHPQMPDPSAAAPAAIVDVTTESFMADVIDASQNQLVLLDLWAPWCGPCKQLTPVLEGLVNGSGGAVRLAKMNIDDHPAVAQQLQVQSIPAVFAFKGGQPVDAFQGVLPESELKKFIDRHLEGGLGPSPVEQMLEVAETAFAADDFGAAAQAYGQVLQAAPDTIAAIAGLAQCQIATGQLAEAAEILAMAPQTNNDPALAAARAALALAEKAGNAAGDLAPLRAALEANPNDHQARFDLAMAHHAAGQKVEAMAALLDIIARQRSWNDEAARRQLLELFDAYGAQDDDVVAARRRLSSVLFS